MISTGQVSALSYQEQGGAVKTYAYTYDSGGNITEETISGTTHTYEYDSTWKDKLKTYDKIGISYDNLGQLTNYLGAPMTWDAAGNLTAIQKGSNPYLPSSNSVTYTYLANGQRHTKTVDGRTTTYHYNNGLLLSETTTDASGSTAAAETIRYYYDSTGAVTSISYQKGSGTENTYFFAYNGQGDVIAVYRSSDSALIGTYEYDLWGKQISAATASASIDTDGILTKNPIRYRGYYYDAETGFYYLNARYYDPMVRRFISADDMRYLGADGTLTGYNLFAYCDNNKIPTELFFK